MVSDVPSLFPIGLSWNIDFSQVLYDWEVDMFGNFSHLLKDVFISPSFSDKKIWVLNSLGNFSSKSMFFFLLPSTSLSPMFPVGRVWKPPIPPRVKNSHGQWFLTVSTH